VVLALSRKGTPPSADQTAGPDLPAFLEFFRKECSQKRNADEDTDEERTEWNRLGDGSPWGVEALMSFAGWVR
jgi:hypothetical protein